MGYGRDAGWAAGVTRVGSAWLGPRWVRVALPALGPRGSARVGSAWLCPRWARVALPALLGRVEVRGFNLAARMAGRLQPSTYFGLGASLTSIGTGKDAG